jgi:hypothetical protein
MYTAEVTMTKKSQKTKTAISASYHRDFDGLMEVRDLFANCGIKVLFPQKCQPTASISDFVILSTDTSRDPKYLQEKNLALIEQCDFLYVYNPDGYIGLSMALEIGFALRHGIQVFCWETPKDLTLSQFLIVERNITQHAFTSYKISRKNK